jgi:hypothetical protein
MTYSVPAREVTRLPPLEGQIPDLGELLLTHLRPRIAVRSHDGPCETSAGPRLLASRRGYVRVEWGFECPADTTLEIENRAFFEIAPSHVHFARIKAADSPPIEYLFTDARRIRTVPLGSEEEQERAHSAGTGFRDFVWLGVEHIAGGFDHLAFLLSLILLASRVREVALLVTGFTLGHSLTLSLAVLGFAKPNVPVIEALIGFTIALVAAENIGVTTNSNRVLAGITGAGLCVLAMMSGFAGVGLPVATLVGLALFSTCYLSLSDTPRITLRLRPATTVLFGLVHGFGFANVLIELGIPRNRLLVGLFGFNVGVEIGQLVIVCALALLGGVLLNRLVRFDRRLLNDALSAALCGLGLYWFVTRAFGV